MAEPQRVVIIGASSGIGREMALWYAKRNFLVGITGRRKNMLDEVAASYPGAMLASAFDVDEVDLLPSRLDELAARLGGVDILVVSAGCGELNPALDPEPECMAVRTNVQAFVAAAVWAFNYFKKRGHGQLAAITSVGGLIGESAAPAYPASKAFQIMYLDSLAKRAKKEDANCVITELRPGSVNTDMMKGEGHFWIASPQAAADLACRAIAGKKRLQYITRRWMLIGWILRLCALFK